MGHEYFDADCRTRTLEDISLCGKDRMKVGDRVRKVKGYRWPGIIVAVFDNLSGDRRYVVECTVPEVAGALHIYSPSQIVPDKEPSDDR